MTSLADPTRLRLLRLLEQHELTVAELCEILQLPQSTVSRHLKVLSERAWLRSRHQGTANLYRMSQHQVHDAATRLWALSKEQSSDWPALKQDRLRLEQHLDRRRTADFFAQAARSWEQLREELHGSNFMRAVLASLIDPELSVVDLGCGTGELLRLLAPRARQVLGVDRSQEMLEAASERVGGYENARLIRADLAALPLASGLWDAVTMLLVLSYLPRPEAAIGELSRLLRPRGRAIVLTLMQHDRDDYRHRMGQTWLGFGVQQMSELFDRAGLDIDMCEALPPEVQARGPALLFVSARRRAAKTSAAR
jgi:ubiquinone/menaquinone biosynthesis C-methylase UbiE